MHHHSGVPACFKHSNLFKVNVPAHLDTQSRAPLRDFTRRRPQQYRSTPQLTRHRHDVSHRISLAPSDGEPTVRDTDPTTSFLTAATFAYAVGAGITAAAGTRLALQLILIKGFRVYSFRLRGLG
ncbi:hypothetical protein ONE63_011484 [Megalurothrips usitatus]|uniref:Uncharacterized protein n=1 Tax=Megalurothrips usitatus TaxID=439358 RepID=A0AAV7X2Q7_9NEOP|nr:hypothetical protein ONE63_011484 [Megalurothrips usitatus]